MTIRQTKRLVMAAGVLIALLVAIDLGLRLLRPGPPSDVTKLVLPLLLVVLLSSVWRRLSRLEAQHGPDYVEPTTGRGRLLIIGLAALAAMLGGVAAYLLATHA
jgi:hypothetical protein